MYILTGKKKNEITDLHLELEGTVKSKNKNLLDKAT